MIAYKATDKDGNTWVGMHWEVGVTNKATGKGTELCSDGVLHVYRTPEQATFMLPAHVDGYTRLFEVDVPKIVADDGTKCGVKEATVVKEIGWPVITIEQRVEIAIRISLLAYKKKSYVKWARGWLSGEDRTAAAAAAWASASWAAWAVEAAAAASWAAEESARAAAAWAVEAAAEAAASKKKPIDIIPIINSVCKKGGDMGREHDHEHQLRHIHNHECSILSTANCYSHAERAAKNPVVFTSHPDTDTQDS